MTITIELTGPPACGKTLTLMRLEKWLASEGWHDFKLHDDYDAHKATAVKDSPVATGLCFGGHDPKEDGWDMTPDETHQ